MFLSNCFAARRGGDHGSFSVRSAMITTAAAAAALLSGNEPLAAELVTVDFSYTFEDGQTLSGTVDGDLQSDGDLVTNLSDLHAVYSGVPGSPFAFLGAGNGDLSLSASQQFEFFGFVAFPDVDVPLGQPFPADFGFCLTDPPGNAAGVTVGDFFTSSMAYVFPSHPESDIFSPDRWVATMESPDPSVPEPGSFTLAGIGLLATAAFYRSRKKRRAFETRYSR